GARLRSVNGAAVSPERGTNRTHASPAGSLLLPEFFARTRDQLLVLGRVRSGTIRGAEVFYRLPKQVFVHRAEDFIGEIQGPDLGSAQIVYVNGCHMLSIWCQSRHSVSLSSDEQLVTTTSYPFFAARLAAFNGSTVADPANPRRSRGGFFALVITRYPPFGPGTLPSTTNRFSSLSTPNTLRLRTVTRASPMCPDMRMPLNTREGNADEPIEPVI